MTANAVHLRSWNLLRWGRDATLGTWQIEQWDFSAGHQAFICAKANDVRPARPWSGRHPIAA